MYELKIKDPQGIWHTADLPKNDLPVMVYKSVELGDLKDRWNNYSYTIKLPKTANNRNIFGFSDEFDVVTDIPYRRLDCRLYANDYTIAGVGAYLRIIRTSNTIDVIIRSGVLDFFTNIQEKKMLDLDLGYVVRGEKLYSENFRNDIYTIPFATYQKGRKKFSSNYPDTTFPAVFVKKTVEKIIEEEGFTLKHNLDGRWEDLAVSIAELKPRQEDIEPFEVVYNQPRYTSGFVDFAWMYFEKGSNNMTSSGGSSFKTLYYKSKFIGNMRIQFHIDIEMKGEYKERDFGIVIKNLTTDSELGAEYQHMKPYEKITIDFDINTDVKVGDEIQFFIDIDNTTSNGMQGRWEYTTKFSITDLEGTEVHVGSKLYLAPNLGFSTQFDYLKAIIQALGLMINVDYSQKIVELYTLDIYYSNKQFSNNWTDKIDMKQEIEFNFDLVDYGRKNTIKFQENSDEKYTDIGFIYVDNDTLQYQKEMFSIPFESGVDTNEIKNLIPSTLTANIPLLEGEGSDSDRNYTFKSGKPHLLKIKPQNKGIPIQVATHIHVQELIEIFYYHLQNDILNKSKIAVAWFNLSDEDIELYNNFNKNANCTGLFVPVYVELFGRYFFVQEINNYQSGKLTKCILVKL